jgi:four helix bundle suffix protein
LADVRAWVEEEKGKGHTNRKEHTDEHGRTRTDTERKNKNQASVSVSAGPCQSVSDSTLVANAALSLLNLCCYLLDSQLAAQAKAFETEGGFTERLYRVGALKEKVGRIKVAGSTHGIWPACAQKLHPECYCKASSGGSGSEHDQHAHHCNAPDDIRGQLQITG